MKLRFGVSEKCVLFLTAGALLCAQGPGPAPGQAGGPGQGNAMGPGGPGMPHHGSPGPEPFHGGPQPQPFAGPGGKFWNNPDIVNRLAITADQQRKMDDVMQQSRLKLIDLSATLQKEEVMLEGLMRGPQLDDSKILPAFDRIAEARAELEKANARMMLGIRHVLTPLQWEKLHTLGPGGGPESASPGPRGPSPNRAMGPGGPPPPGAPNQEEE